MNAHINLDLGIAAAATSPGDQLPFLKADFDQINEILAAEVATVEREIAEVSPSIGLLEKLGMRRESTIINFDLVKARDFGWANARRFAVTPAGAIQHAIDRLDIEVELFGRLVLEPPPPFDLKLLPLRIPESNDIRRVIDVLSRR